MPPARQCLDHRRLVTVRHDRADQRHDHRHGNEQQRRHPARVVELVAQRPPVVDPAAVEQAPFLDHVTGPSTASTAPRRRDGATRGRKTVNVLPRPTVDSSRMRPPWRSSRRRTSASPRPVPSRCARGRTDLAELLEDQLLVVRRIPTPWSATSTRTPSSPSGGSPARPPPRAPSPPSREENTCGVGEQVEQHLAQLRRVGDQRRQVRRQLELDLPTSPPRCAHQLAHLADHSTGSSGSARSSSGRPRSSTGPAVVDQLQQVLAAAVDVGENRRCSRTARPQAVGEDLREADDGVSGVRSSWLMLERNTVLARLASSAALRLVARRSESSSCSPSRRASRCARRRAPEQRVGRASACSRHWSSAHTAPTSAAT